MVTGTGPPAGPDRPKGTGWPTGVARPKGTGWPTGAARPRGTGWPTGVGGPSPPAPPREPGAATEKPWARSRGLHSRAVTYLVTLSLVVIVIGCSVAGAMVGSGSGPNFVDGKAVNLPQPEKNATWALKNATATFESTIVQGVRASTITTDAGRNLLVLLAPLLSAPGGSGAPPKIAHFRALAMSFYNAISTRGIRAATTINGLKVALSSLARALGTKMPIGRRSQGPTRRQRLPGRQPPPQRPCRTTRSPPPVTDGALRATTQRDWLCVPCPAARRP